MLFDLNLLFFEIISFNIIYKGIFYEAGKVIMKKSLKKVILFLALFSIQVGLFSIEFSFKLSPDFLFPFLTNGDEKYDKLSFGGFLDTGVNLFDFLNIGTSLGFYSVPIASKEALLSNQDKYMFLVPVGATLGTYFYPVSRLELGASVAAGSSIAYRGSNPQDKFHYSPWYRASVETAFRITPDFSIAMTGSWFDSQYDSYFGGKNVCAGLSAGISIKYNFDTQKTLGAVDASVQQDESVFPLFYTIYKNNYFGTITLKNNETAEIRDVEVFFRSEGYTNAEIECGKIKVLRKHRTEEIPLCADFSENILQFTENGKIPGEVVVRYELLGQKRESVSQVIIPVYNRNQVRWTYPAVIASYISSSAQEILEFSKYLVGVARTYLRSGLNRNMQFAMYVFEGIRLAGIKCETDVSSPYNQFHLDPSALDYIQYPYQTMLYKTGDKDDLGILLMALFQSVGITSSFITTSDDFIVLFDTGINVSKAGSLFDGLDRVLVFDNNIWIPLSMAALNEGFINSWYGAVVEVQEANEKGEEIGFVNLSEAWQYYPPAGFSSGEKVSLATSESQLASAVETDIARYITAEFGPQIAAVQTRIVQEGASVDLYNKLGMLYVRAGMYTSAIPVYQMSAKMGSVTAMNNLGNIASLQKKYTEALAWYKKALELEPDNKTALKNLNRLQADLDSAE